MSWCPSFFVVFLSRHLYYLYLFGVCHAAHCGPVHPRGVGAVGRLRPRWQPNRGGQADVDGYGDHCDICDDDDRDTISWEKSLVGFCHVFSLLVVHHNNHHGVVSLDSIAVSLFGNKTVETGEILIITKESDASEQKIQIIILILKWGPCLGFVCYYKDFVGDKSQQSKMYSEKR